MQQCVEWRRQIHCRVPLPAHALDPNFQRVPASHAQCSAMQINAVTVALVFNQASSTNNQFDPKSVAARFMYMWVAVSHAAAKALAHAMMSTDDIVGATYRA